MAIRRLLKSIYIHIPFCKSKCNYCNFVSFAGKEKFKKSYLKALEQEVTYNLGELDKIVNTVYVGGGTPSTIDSFFYEKLLSLINFQDNAEVTIEINPGTVSAEYLKKLRKAGFNRLSIGVQSFNNNVLKVLNRAHSCQDTVNTVKDAKNAGFENISIDLIYGLPGQTLADWNDTLYQAINLDLQHISAYGLKIEEGTQFHANPPKNLPDEDIVVNMYMDAIKILEQNNFNHYEISNFSKPGYESQHNLTYWNNEEYWGFGLGAHGYVNGVRYSNKGNLNDYIDNPLEKADEQHLSEKEKQEEAIFLGLRLRKGIGINDLFRKKYADVIAKHLNLGLLKLEGSNLSLTHQGILLSNSVMADFLEDSKIT